MQIDTAELTIKDKFISLYESNKDHVMNGSTSLINEKRKLGIDYFNRLGIPNIKNEDYKYTNLDPIIEANYTHRFKPSKIDFLLDEIFRCDIPELDTHMVVLINGWYFENQPAITELEGGVIVGSFQKASQEYPDLFKKHYSKYANFNKDGLAALNTAFAQDGFFIHFPKNSKTNKSIQIINLMMFDKNLMSSPRNLIVCDENSDANIIICDHSLSPHQFLTNSVTEIYVGENASLHYTKMQNEHNAAAQIAGTYIYQEKDSRAFSNTITLHGGFVRNSMHVLLNGEGAENNTFGLFLADRGQHIDHFTNIDHAKPNCLSNQLVKGILDDYATGAFNGKILVRKDAQKTNAFQRNNNILLTDDAKMNTKPQLEIYADDVKCSHGATVGQIDQNALFYLRSRGIVQREAIMLLMYAFAHEIIENIQAIPLRDRIHDLVNKRLRGELSRCNKCALQCH